MLNRRNNDFMDIELLANKINLNSELKNKVLSLVERDRAKLISFCKIAAHTGNHYNEEADQLAKSALLKADEEVRI